MSQDQPALQSCIGVHQWWGLHQVHDSSQHAEAHSTDGVGETVPLAGDVGLLELELSRGKPSVESLGPEIAELDLALPGLLLLLDVILISDSSQHLQEGVRAVHRAHLNNVTGNNSANTRVSSMA